MRRIWFVIALVTMIAGQLFDQKAFALGIEEKGNGPLNEFNYTEWKGIVPIVNDTTRVYQVWVNGNEFLYYQGTTKQLNAALIKFAKVEVKNHVVALRPGPVEQRSFHDKTPIPFNWELHLIGGLTKSKATNDIEDLEWQKDPVLTVYIGGDIDLGKLEIPEGVTLRAAPGKNPEASINEAVGKKIKDFVERQKHETKK
ncbi:MAG: hypothetical protein V4719_22025 [Planctomycetota bacterium]